MNHPGHLKDQGTQAQPSKAHELEHLSRQQEIQAQGKLQGWPNWSWEWNIHPTKGHCKFAGTILATKGEVMSESTDSSDEEDFELLSNGSPDTVAVQTRRCPDEDLRGEVPKQARLHPFQTRKRGWPAPQGYDIVVQVVEPLPLHHKGELVQVRHLVLNQPLEPAHRTQELCTAKEWLDKVTH